MTSAGVVQELVEHAKTLGLRANITRLDDGGVAVDVETYQRELTFVIPKDWEKRFFHVADSSGYRQNGLVHPGASPKGLFDWVSGRTDKLSSVGLVLPRIKRHK